MCEKDFQPDSPRPHLATRVLDRDLVAAVTARVREAAQARGWIDRDGRAAARMHGRRLVPDDPDYVSFLADVLARPEVEVLRRDPKLHAAVARACGTPLTPIRADVCRITFPGEPQGTPAHQDAWYCRATRLWIAWIPLVACPGTLGPLEIAGPEETLLAHDERGLTADPGTRWCSPSCAPGDVLLFSGLTPHRSRPNRSTDRPRLSLDLRFAQDAG